MLTAVLDAPQNIKKGQVAQHPRGENTYAKLDAALAQFRSHNLSDLKKAELMDRVDSKFVVPLDKLPSLLSEMSFWYSVLEVEGKRKSKYHNVYFDTDNYVHYFAHHNRRAGRFKVRQRTYVESDLSFLEVKYRNNLARTIKTRIQVPTGLSSFGTQELEFLNKSGVLRFGQLESKQEGTYNRIALANEGEGERITIDLQLAVTDLCTSKEHSIGPWVVVEVKQQQLNRRSPFFAWARENSVRRCSFSKYCMGLYYTGPSWLKRNNFHNVARQMKPIRKLARSPEPVFLGESYSDRNVSTL